MESPLSRAWSALTSYPALILIPIAWDALNFGLAWLFSGEVVRQERPDVNVKFLLPSGLPSGNELLGQAPNLLAFNSLPVWVLLIGLVMAAVSAFVTAGFLHLAAGTLNDRSPAWDGFVEGINRFGGRLFLWNLIVTGVVLFGALLATTGSGLALLFLIAGLIAAVAYCLVPFLIVTDDLGIGEAIAQAPGRLGQEFGSLIGVAVLSVIISAALSFFLSALGAQTLLLASPLWAFFGTFATLGVLAVLLPAHSSTDTD